MEITKRRAAKAILDHLKAFPTRGNLVKDFFNDKVKVGDLVNIMSLPEDSNMRVCWVRQIQKFPFKEKSYFLESIKDGCCAWIPNPAIRIFNRENLALHPSWHWNDNQFAFNDRWLSTCYITRIAFQFVPIPENVVFNEDGSIALEVTVKRYDYSARKIFPDWKILTMKTMKDFYQYCLKEYNETV